MFTDEKLFRGQPANSQVLIRRVKGERFLPQNILYEKTGGPTCNVWYSIGPFGKGRIYLAENDRLYDYYGNKLSRAAYQGFDNRSYVNLLDRHALPELNWRMAGGSRGYYFMQDNASIHTKQTPDRSERMVDSVFREHGGVRCLKWPAKSPDLNPIENVNSLIQRQLNDLLEKFRPKNKKELFLLIRQAYKKVPNQKVINCYNSFNSRCLKVWELKGRNNYEA